jgi:hypothetical protein
MLRIVSEMASSIIIVPKARQKIANKKRETSEINYRAVIYVQVVLYSSEKDSAINKAGTAIHALRCDQEHII